MKPRYRGPQGQLQRAIAAELRQHGQTVRLPDFTDDRPRRSAMERMIARGFLERVPGKAHLARLRVRRK